MKFILKIIVIFSILFIIQSCDKSKYYYPIELKFENNAQEQINKTAIGDSLEIIIFINDTLNLSNNFILETPYNINFKLYQNTQIITTFSKGKIRNQEVDFIKEGRIPITRYYRNNKFLLSKDLDVKKPLILKTKRKKNIYNIVKDFKLWGVSDKTTNYNGEETFEIITHNYFEESKLPILKIATNTLISEKKAFAKYNIISNDKGFSNSISDSATISGDLKIKVRGQTSKTFPKQSYSIFTYSKKHKKKNVSLLGLPKESDWVLYGPYVDLSLMRNVLSYELYAEMGYYSPRTKFCELIINNDYRGIYVLIEKIKRDKNRVNVKKFDKKNVVEYIVKLDKGLGKIWRSPYDSQIDTGWGKWFYYVYPKAKSMTVAQRLTVRESITEFETALVKNQNWKNYININSFVDYLIINELAKNIDAYRLSTHLYKDSTKKINIGPVWDFNFSFGLTKHEEGYKTDGLIYKSKAIPFWWGKLMQDKEFANTVQNRWTALRKTILSEKNIFSIIDKNAKILSPNIKQNDLKWKSLGSENLFRENNFKTYKKEITYIKEWITKRCNYLDNNLVKKTNDFI